MFQAFHHNSLKCCSKVSLSHGFFLLILSSSTLLSLFLLSSPSLFTHHNTSFFSSPFPLPSPPIPPFLYSAFIGYHLSRVLRVCACVWIDLLFFFSPFSNLALSVPFNSSQPSLINLSRSIDRNHNKKRGILCRASHIAFPCRKKKKKEKIKKSKKIKRNRHRTRKEKYFERK